MMPMELSFAGALLVARLRSFLQLNVVAFVNERDFPHSVAHVTLILKTTRSQYGSPLTMLRMITLFCMTAGSLAAYFSNRKHRKDARGSGQSLLASIPHQFTVAAIQRHASKQWPTSKRSG